MQVPLLQYLGWILLIIGITLVIAAVISAKREAEGNETRTQSKGVILLGVIPIVWGYGKKGWMITGAIGIILCLVWIVFFL
ncbi:MAG: DUF131 domain-containing protein [Candidatus Thorarchaeota archaeon]|nr:MAG: DUF131 domain-containing protein [Candidatus Thorarchaeota archaeon]